MKGVTLLKLWPFCLIESASHSEMSIAAHPFSNLTSFNNFISAGTIFWNWAICASYFSECFAKGVFYLITIMNRLIIVENYLCYLEKDVNIRVGKSGIGETGIGESGTTRWILIPERMESIIDHQKPEYCRRWMVYFIKV